MAYAYITAIGLMLQAGLFPANVINNCKLRRGRVLLFPAPQHPVDAVDVIVLLELQREVFRVM